MTVEILNTTRGFVFEVNTVPAGFLASLERRGLAASPALTSEGFYCEPRQPLGSIVSALDAAGVEVRAVRPSSETAGWRFFARPAAGAHRRLTSLRSATWLPTVPA